MEFMEIDLTTASQEQIKEAIDYNNRVNNYFRAEINKLKNASRNNKNKNSIVYRDDILNVPKKEPKLEEEKTIDIDFENEVKNYLSKLNKLKLSNIEKDFWDAIPLRNNSQYESLLLRLKLESVRVLKEIKEISHSVGSSFEEVDDFCEEVEIELKKIALIAKALIPQKEESQEEEKKNKLIFVPTSSGDIKIFDEINKIPSSYYESLKKLFESIEDGTFKNFKRFNNNKELDGLCEVKGDGIRVAYVMLNKDTYAIVSAFIKRTNVTSVYRRTLAKKYNDFLAIKAYLEEQIKNEEFLKLNELYKESLYEKLEPTSKVKILHKKKVGEA